MRKIGAEKIDSDAKQRRLTDFLRPQSDKNEQSAGDGMCECENQSRLKLTQRQLSLFQLFQTRNLFQSQSNHRRQRRQLSVRRIPPV